MEDLEIIDLYFSRKDEAIWETEKKYGKMCLQIASHILPCREDAEECVNDAYLKAWNAIPPARPNRLGVWLGRVVRNTALNLWKKNHRKKRWTGFEQLFSELEECIPSPAFVYTEHSAVPSIHTGISAMEEIEFTQRYYTTPHDISCLVMAGSPMKIGRVFQTGYLVKDGILYSLHLSCEEEERQQVESLLRQWADSF